MGPDTPTAWARPQMGTKTSAAAPKLHLLNVRHGECILIDSCSSPGPSKLAFKVDLTLPMSSRVRTMKAAAESNPHMRTSNMGQTSIVIPIDHFPMIHENSLICQLMQ